MIDKTILASRFRKSADTYEANATVQKVIAERLFTLTRKHTAVFPARVLEIGCGTGLLTRNLCRIWPDKELWVNDLVEDMCRKTADLCGLPVSRCLVGDIETLELPGRFGLITSASTFQWLTHPAQMYVRLAACLEPKGILAFSCFGKDNLYELKSLTGYGLSYLSPEEQRALLEPNFEILYQEEARHTLYFEHPLEILRHLKHTGVNALTGTQPWGKKRLDEFSGLYTARFLTDGRYPLTYHPYYLICRKRS